MAKRWNFKCGLCNAKFETAGSAEKHRKAHQKNGKFALILSKEELQREDYSEAEYELRRRHNI